MMFGRRLSPALLSMIALVSASVGAQTELEDRIRHRIEAGLTTDSLDVMAEPIHARATIRRVYAERGYAPIWVDDSGPTAAAEAFEAWLARVPTLQGLRGADYHLAVIELLSGIDRTTALVDVELALSDAFLMVGSHLLAGRVNPESLDAEWIANRRHRDLAPLLEQAASSASPGALLEGLLPAHVEYSHLIERLSELRAIEADGGWPEVEPGPALRAGDAGHRIAQLIRRLEASGDLATGSESTEFTAVVADAVAQFQARHGLEPDSVVGPATLRALNVPVSARIDQIIVNLERWRWLPESLGERYVIVNIAGFSLDVVEEGESTLSMRVVVGRQYRRTPVFSDNIRYLVLNPSWEVPSRIAAQDKLPLIRTDPTYLEREGYSLLQGWGADERRIDPASVDWSTVNARNFPYRLRQAPGPFNALGRVKFMFPNRFSVYLHDTPSRELFRRADRAFSSGCIRLEAPLELAELLLADNPRWDRRAIDRAVQSGEEQSIRLSSAVPVHLLYWTAWSNDDDTIHYREDIYGRDTPLLRELLAAPPS